jgi:hypothetical protein
VRRRTSGSGTSEAHYASSASSTNHHIHRTLKKEKKQRGVKGGGKGRGGTVSRAEAGRRGHGKGVMTKEEEEGGRKRESVKEGRAGARPEGMGCIGHAERR